MHNIFEYNFNEDLEIIESISFPEPLSKEEIYELFKENTKESKEKIILYNIKLVLYITSIMYSQYFDQGIKNDLHSIGMIALINAVYNFDISKNNEFSTYATHCIKNEINKYVNKKRFSCYNTANLDSTIKNPKTDSETPIIDTVKADLDIEEDYLRKELFETILDIIESLPEKRKNIFKSYYGIKCKQLKQHEIAKIYGVSINAISLSLKRTLRYIKKEIKNYDYIPMKDYTYKRQKK